MINKCKLETCNKELVHTPGRRPKEFCSSECRSLFHNKKKSTGKGRGRPKGSKNKVNYPQGITQVTEETKEIVDAISSAGFSQPYDDRTNPLINIARGRDESGVNEDELEFDFRGEKFLDIEKHTKYPKKDRPTNKGEAITWDNLKKESDQRIKEAWAKRKTVQ